MLRRTVDRRVRAHCRVDYRPGYVRVGQLLRMHPIPGTVDQVAVVPLLQRLLCQTLAAGPRHGIPTGYRRKGVFTILRSSRNVGLGLRKV